jgi:hypothetical protein
MMPMSHVKTRYLKFPLLVGVGQSRALKARKPGYLIWLLFIFSFPLYALVLLSHLAIFGIVGVGVRMVLQKNFFFPFSESSFLVSPFLALSYFACLFSSLIWKS